MPSVIVAASSVAIRAANLKQLSPSCAVSAKLLCRDKTAWAVERRPAVRTAASGRHAAGAHAASVATPFLAHVLSNEGAGRHQDSEGTGDLGWPMVGPSLRVPQKHLGRGSYGHVFLAEDLPRNGSKRDVAVKLLQKETTTGQSQTVCCRESLRREAEILEALQGKPNIVELRGLYEDDQFAYIAMEPCDSGDLQGLLDRNEGAMREGVVAGLARQMCQAMLGVHEENVCYSDVKPANFLLHSNDELVECGGVEIKLADFGCSQECNDSMVLTKKTGTPLYTAPEVYLGRYSQAADMWGLGMILYRMVSGVYPFRHNLDALPAHSMMNAVMTFDLSFDDEVFCNVSPMAQDLLRSLLSRRTDRRMTAEEALQHPWLSTDSTDLTTSTDLELGYSNAAPAMATY